MSAVCILAQISAASNLAARAAHNIARLPGGVAVFTESEIVLVSRKYDLNAGALEEAAPMTKMVVTRGMQRPGLEWRIVKVGNFP
jgi:hypothetical protein